MSKPLTICIVGAGSSYTGELIEGLLARPLDELPVARLHLTDSDDSRLAIMAGLAERMIRRSRRAVAVASSIHLEPMLEGADFVICQIRVGGMAARHLDETIPLKYGIIGQETTGPGGMFKALRTIPPMIKIAATVARVAPHAFILNYSNPSGIVAEAVTKYSQARFVGLCSGIPGIQQRLQRQLSSRYPDLKTYCVGLNHLGFVHKMLCNGRDVTREAIDYLAAQEQKEPAANADPSLHLAKVLGAIPISYARYYFQRGYMLDKARTAAETRAQQVMKIEREVLAQAADAATDTKPEALRRRGGGGYAAITLSFLSAIHHDTGAELVASVPNRGCVEGIDSDASVEVVCKVNRRGPVPLPVGAIPLAFRGVVQAVKAYETLVVEAAVRQDRKLALQALLNHPLAGDLAVCEPLLDEMTRAHHIPFGAARAVHD
jgi:6-phospho-beta-glucosidase